MSLFHTISFIHEQLPDFDASSEQQIERANKILTIALRENVNFQKDDIETTIKGLRDVGIPFYEWLKNSRNSKLFLETEQERQYKLTHYSIHFNSFKDDQLKYLSNVIQNDILELIQKNSSDFSRLNYILEQYYPIISVETKDVLTTQVISKLKSAYQAQLTAAPTDVVNNYPFLLQPDFYRLLTQLHSNEIDKILVDIIAKNHSGSSPRDKIAQAKIILTISNYHSQNPDVARYIKAKQEAALMEKMNETTLFSDKEKRLLQNWVIGKDSWTDVLIILGHYAVILLILYCAYHYIHPIAGWWLILLSVICIFPFHKAPNNWGVDAHDYSIYPTFKRIKKIHLDMYIILNYISIVVGIGSVLIGTLAYFAWINTK